MAAAVAIHPRLVPDNWEQPLIFAWILRIRVLATIVLTVALQAAYLLHIIDLASFSKAMLVIGCLLVSLVYGWWARRAVIKPGRWWLFMQMSFDLCAFIGILLLTGAHTNPFHGFYFFYAVLGAFWMTRLRAFFYILLWCAGLVVLGHYYLVPFSQPFAETWLLPRLVVGCVLFASVFAVGNLVRRYRRHLEQYHRRQSYAERLQSLGALTAGLCHQLHSPLNTALLRVDRLKRHGLADKNDVLVLERALGKCRDALQSLLDKRLDPSGLHDVPVALDSYVEEVFHSWCAARPHQALAAEFQWAHQGRVSFPPLPVAEMIWDLLDNAGEAMATRGRVVFSSRTDARVVALSIRDFGPGFPAGVMRALGEPFCTSKAEGRGLGLYNAFLLMNALGGELQLTTPADGGACVSMIFPRERYD